MFLQFCNSFIINVEKPVDEELDNSSAFLFLFFFWKKKSSKKIRVLCKQLSVVEDHGV